MSGGSYNYLYSKDAADLFGDGSASVDLQEMADRLAGLSWADDAAADVHDLLAVVRVQKARVDAALRRLSGVLQAVEWWDSHDTSEDGVRQALAEYRGEAT
jgi:hypothetical protein